MRSQLGISLLLASVVGFYLYQDCCSYSARNGWWVLAFLIGSATCSLLNFSKSRIETKITFQFNWLYYLGLLILLSVLLGSINTMDELSEISKQENDKLIPEGIDVLKHLPELGDHGVFITRDFPMAYHYKLYGKVSITFDFYKHIKGINGALSKEDCNISNDPDYHYIKHKTLDQVLECKPKSLIHIRKADFPKLVNANPSYNFTTIESRNNYKLVKPIIKEQLLNSN
jgi:hypothetical protein